MSSNAVRDACGCRFLKALEWAGDGTFWVPLPAILWMYPSVVHTQRACFVPRANDWLYHSHVILIRWEVKQKLSQPRAHCAVPCLDFDNHCILFVLFLKNMSTLQENVACHMLQSILDENNQWLMASRELCIQDSCKQIALPVNKIHISERHEFF